jgi:outer membrane receptor protein involved in Fe transport
MKKVAIPVIRNAELPFHSRAHILRPTALAALSAAGAIVSPLAFGQTQTDDEPIQQVVITGTNIVRDGYSAPTPITVVGQDQFQTSATSNLADYVNTMPVFANSQTPTNQYHQSSNGLAGLNTLNLRSVGSSRTLVLIDGQRSVGSTTTGLVDINNIPQDLVTRVDVVTGGASAVYGSDALSGVVNFVLDDTFVGTKVGVSGGATNYGDAPNWKASLTKGIGFAGDRGHFIVSGEIARDYGIRGVPRDWNNGGVAIISNPAYTETNGQPRLIRVNQASLYTATWGGIITNAPNSPPNPLANTAFGPGGTPTIFHLGSITSNPYTVGGDWASNPSNTIQSLTPEMDSERIFTRASFDITDNINVFGQFSWASTDTLGYNEPNFYFGNLVVKSDNAFIPAAIASRLNALGMTQFNMGTLNGDLPDWGNDTSRDTKRYVVGAKGNFDAVGSNWSWNGYYQRGKTEGEFQAVGVSNRARYMLAIDAVRDPNTGAIVCRSSLSDPTNGCVPYNLFGTGVNTQAAINYIEPFAPTQNLSLTQDVWSGQISGEPFSDWAGPVSLAAGVQHRREAVEATADALSGTWFAANYAPINGSYTVTEGSLETVVPLARDKFLAKSLDLNAAVRFTDYSVSGSVTTWKVGATWDVIPDVRFRATRSRDIRAPNLSELYQAGAGGTGQIFDDFRGQQPVAYRIVQAGNLGLEPEKADNMGAGVVLTPSFLPNFNFSADYWRIDISQAIGTINSQQQFDLCYQGLQQFCSFITPDPSTLSAAPNNYVIVNSPVNLASQKASGIDFEASYRFNLGDLVSGWAGNLDLRYLGTNYIKNVTDNRVAPPVDQVGASLPKWNHHLTATYTYDQFKASLTGRAISAGVIDPTYVECSSACPTATLNNPTVDDAHQPGIFYLDSSLAYDFTVAGTGDLQVYLNIQNLLNKDPPVVPLPLNGLVPYFSVQTNPSLYDVLGRTYRLGFRLNL